jgi:hypothetical protein
MKKYLLTVMSILPGLVGFAQNYDCFQPGVNNYFTDGNDYLRGIRIDSVVQNGNNTVYYPFHTARGHYLANPYAPALDSTGGSWLGKKVIKASDGTYYFDNIWHDTCVIKTQANVGDSWVFFNDATTRYYMALLQSVDTMTVLGNIDSIKTILITAHDINGIITADPVDSFQIFLSKNHGFVQIFDLYTFPYHAPDTVYGSGIDYYLNKLVDPMWYYSLFYPPYHGLNKHTLVFNLIRFNNPTMQELNSFNVGDVYEHTKCEAFYLSVCDPPDEISYDSIIGKVITPTMTTYTYAGFVNVLSLPLNNFNFTYTTQVSQGSFSVDTTHLVNTSFMPEEYSQPWVYYYRLQDTTHCLPGTWVLFFNNEVQDITYYEPFEGPFTHFEYKEGLGLIHGTSLMLDGNSVLTDSALIYFRKNDTSCGKLINLKTTSPVKPASLTVYPNPAIDFIQISNSDNSLFAYNLYNVIGQQVISGQISGGLGKVDVRGLTPGMYSLVITDRNGTRTTQKIVVQH